MKGIGVNVVVDALYKQWKGSMKGGNELLSNVVVDNLVKLESAISLLVDCQMKIIPERMMIGLKL